MSTFQWIFVSGLLMSCIALSGSITLIFKESLLKKILLPLVAFAAGSLIGGALFHMLPAAVHHLNNDIIVYIWLVAGFLFFLILEQLLHWHHCHKTPSEHKHPLSYLMLLADGVHNFVGGIAVGASFMVDIKLGITAWLVAAAHEVPQEMGDFGVLIYSGWDKRKALFFNLLSGLTFLVGGLVVYFASSSFKVEYLIPFAAGNFLYIGASDLVPEIKAGHNRKGSLIHTLCFCLGLGLLLVLRFLLPHSH